MLCGDTKEIMRKNSEKGRKFRLPGRNRAEDETPRILFKDAAALYIEFSKAATAAETAIKRMRIFVRFFLPGTRSLILLSACFVIAIILLSSLSYISRGSRRHFLARAVFPRHSLRRLLTRSLRRPPPFYSLRIVHPFGQHTFSCHCRRRLPPSAHGKYLPRSHPSLTAYARRIHLKCPNSALKKKHTTNITNRMPTMIRSFRRPASFEAVFSPPRSYPTTPYAPKTSHNPPPRTNFSSSSSEDDAFS